MTEKKTPPTVLPKLGKKFDTNPFLEELVVSGRRKMTILHAPTENKSIVSAETDEGAGSLVFAKRDTVDEEQFVKLYTNHIRAWLDLSKTGQKVLIAALYAVQHSALGKDEIYLSAADIEERVALKADAAQKGLRELCASRLLAPSARAANFYFFNPKYIFNGDRFSYFQEVRRARKKEDTLTPQLPYFDPASGRIEGGEK